jgi:tripartite-type tricarboxylate transporter receptor subunit TctC
MREATMKRVLPSLGLICLGVAVALAGAASAQTYPDRPVRMLVPNPPGGATDNTARLVAPRLSELLGQPVVIDNKPGANGNLATELAARATPDGYTLYLAADAQIVISPHLYAMPVDPLKDLLPVAPIGLTTLVLSVNPSLPPKTFQEFVEFAKKAAAPLPYASIGTGSQHHLTMEILKQRAGLALTHVPYRGGGPALVALMGNEVAAMFGGSSTAQQVKSGQIRGLAVTSARRSPQFPDLPAIAEFYPGFASNAWHAVFAPVGTPGPVVARLRAEMGRVLATPGLFDRLAANGMEPLALAPDEFSLHPRRA